LAEKEEALRKQNEDMLKAKIDEENKLKQEIQN
jgi:hypothetical protein